MSNSNSAMKKLKRNAKRVVRKIRRGVASGKRKVYLVKAADLAAGADKAAAGNVSAAKEIAGYIASNRNLLTKEELLKLSTSLAGVVSAMLTGPEAPEELREVTGLLWDIEKDKKFKKYMKSYYIKELYPKIYAELSEAPVEDKVIMMESGNSPSPSSKHLADVIEAQGKYEVKYIGLRIRAVPMSVFYENGIKLIKELATTRAIFLSTANELLSHIDIRDETKVIQLWHGVGAFKHVGHSTAGNAHFGKTQKQWEEYDSYRNYYAVTIAGEGQRRIFKDAMQLRDSQILPIGISRTDVFFDPQYKHDALEKLYAEYPQIKGKKIILYAPTFRGLVAEGKAPDKLDVTAMAEKLSDEYVLLIKHHGLSHDIPPIPEGLENQFAFDLNAHKVLDIDELLAVSDILITDYSSVAFEFAIMERPIIFFTYDLEEYIEERGLYFDFEKDAPGPLCRDTGSIIEYIKGLDKSFDKEKLLAFRKQYVEACDGHATERTIELI